MGLQAFVPAESGSVSVLNTIRKRAGIESVSDQELFRRTYCCYHDRSLSDAKALAEADGYHRQYSTGGPLPLFVLRYADESLEIPIKLRG